MKLYHPVLVLLFISLLSSCGNSATPLPIITPTVTPTVVMVSNNTLRAATENWPPGLIYEGENTTGFVIDIIAEINKATGYNIVYKQMPKMRILEEFRANHIDLELGSNPLWRPEDKDISVYTIPYYQSISVVLMNKGSNFKPKTVQDFRGKRIGVSVGYGYPDFQPEFDSGAIIREDAPGYANNIQKLLAKRVDAIFIDKVAGLYWMKQLNINPDEFEVVYEIGRDDFSFRLRKEKQDMLPKLNEAIETLKTKGVIQDIVDRYTK